VSSQYNGPAIQEDGYLSVGNIPGTITFSGVVADATGTPTTTFTVAPCTYMVRGSIHFCTVFPSSPVTTLPTVGSQTGTPSASWNGFEGGFYLATMTTTVGGTTFSTTNAIIDGTLLQ
jgi:hypothetical protein